VRMSRGSLATAQRYAFGVPRRLIPAAICALGAHALLYGSFRPDDGLHGYLGWYEPVLAVAAIAAVVLVRPASLRSPLPIGDTARGLATWALLVVLVQESLERSVQVGHPAVAALTPSGWLVLVIGVTATAFVLALALRAGQIVFSLITGGTPTRRLPLLVPWKTTAVALPAARPLAGNVALRAPPALAR
jgi:hypothetical protein